MSDMSSILKELEEMKIPSKTIIRATRIPKLLKLIKELPEIPNQDEFDLKGRAGSLRDKWNATLEPVALAIDLTDESELPTPRYDDGDGLGASLSPSSKFSVLLSISRPNVQ